MKKKMTITGISSVILVGVALVVLNLISVKVFGRLDLTDGKIYSLSQSSKDLMTSLDDRVTITCYFSEEIPPPYNAISRYVKDQLAEYKAYSGGKLRYSFVDPIKEGKEEEVRNNRIPSAPIQSIARDKMEIKQVYMGMVIGYEDQKEILPFIQNTATLEYEITRAIRKLTRRITPGIGFVTGHGELSLETDLTYINQVISREYEIETIDLKTLPSIPTEIKTVFVIGPKTPFGDWELYLLDQFLMRGGKIGLLLDKVDAQIQQGTAQPIDPGFDPFLQHFGIKVNSDMVIDNQNAQIAVQRQEGFFRIQSLKEYPFFPHVTNFSKENLIVNQLEFANFLFASSIDTSGFTSTGLSYEVLARSSKKSGKASPPYDINPFREWSPFDFNAESIPLGVAVTGEFASYYTGKPKPSRDTIIVDDLTTEVVESRLDSGAGGRLVVWGDADFVSDMALGDRTKTNLVLFQNMTDWLSEDEGLISIRSKEVTARPLDNVEDSTRSFVKFLNMFLMPLVVVIFGVARWQIRKQKQRRQLV